MAMFGSENLDQTKKDKMTGASSSAAKGHWGPNCFFVKSLFLLPQCTQSWYTQSYEYTMANMTSNIRARHTPTLVMSKISYNYGSTRRDCEYLNFGI